MPPGSHAPSRVTAAEWILIGIVVACMAAVLFTGWSRAETAETARRLKNELEEIDRRVRPFADEQRLATRDIAPEEYRPLVRESFRRIREEGTDPLGNPYPPIPRGGRIAVPLATAEALDGLIHPTVWRPFVIEGQPARPASGLPNP